jgi:predicted metalloprotease
MDWEDRPESENVEDRRGLGRQAGLAVGGIGGILLVILAIIFGVDPRQFLGRGGVRNAGPHSYVASPEDERLAHFSKVIFHDTEVVWTKLFEEMGRTYQKPVLVLFTGHVDSACGQASAAVGPFYCPADARVYLDLSFFREMQEKLHAPGEFARAYVIAHEVGHHVQNLLGYTRRVDSSLRSANKAQANRLSVRLELQADYLAGVWAHHGQRFLKLTEEDIRSGLHAANEIGDDRLQMEARGYVVPDSFTHGTSEQRVRWFQKGLRSGDVQQARQLFELKYDDL